MGIDRSGQPQQAVDRVAEAIVREQDAGDRLDLAAYFDSVRHDSCSRRWRAGSRTREILHLLKLMLKASGSAGFLRAG